LQKCFDVALRFGITFINCHQHADAPHPLTPLRVRRERPRSRRSAEQRDELAPFHCPILPCFRQKG
jgi:hypothetical protein